MAFFNFRKPQPEAGTQAAAASDDNPELIRRRARQRLMGATVLVLLAVIGLPLLFDSQPRPIPVDIPIDIPDRNKTKPLVSAGEAAVPASAALASAAASAPSAKAIDGKPEPAAADAKPQPQAEPRGPTQVEPRPESKPEPKPEAKAEVKPAAKGAEKAAEKPADKNADKAPEKKPEAPKAEAKSTVKVETKPDVKPAAKDEAARALALLEGRGNADVADTRFVVQVGAYAEADKAREVRLTIERSGLKTYTHVAETREGKRIRVRLGPFTNRADADRAAGKVKALGLDASVLSL